MINKIIEAKVTESTESKFVNDGTVELDSVACEMAINLVCVDAFLESKISSKDDALDMLLSEKYLEELKLSKRLNNDLGKLMIPFLEKGLVKGSEFMDDVKYHLWWD